MSREALAGFMSALEKDPTLQEELKSAVEGTGEEAAVPTERFVEIAGARGFDFTVDEALGIFELSDDELESVSGGAVFAKYEGKTGLRGGTRMLKEELGKPIPAHRLGDMAGFKFF
jgi:predicted ribosomally synthesized peptide with nif11-like leader